MINLLNVLNMINLLELRTRYVESNENYTVEKTTLREREYNLKQQADETLFDEGVVEVYHISKRHAILPNFRFH